MRPIGGKHRIAALLYALASDPDDGPSDRIGSAGSARDYLNAPIDIWLTLYNFGYSRLVRPRTAWT